MKCSVIVACYNNPDLILGTLASIEKQTYPHWELVLVDDFSTDSTLQVLQQHIYTSPLRERYRLINLPENRGVSYAKGTGIQNSDGDIIVICDHDDALAPNALEEIVQVHKLHANASIVHTQHYNCDSQLKPIQINSSCGPILYSDILEDKVSHLLTYKRAYYNQTSGYDSFFKIADDKDIIYKLEEVGDVIFIPKPLYYFRISSRGASQGYENFNRSRDEKLKAVQNAIVRRNRSLIKQISQSAFDKLLAEHYLLQAEGYILMNKPLNASFVSSLLRAYYYNPRANLKRKFKATFILSRIKRTLLKLKKTL